MVIKKTRPENYGPENERVATKRPDFYVKRIMKNYENMFIITPSRNYEKKIFF